MKKVRLHKLFVYGTLKLEAEDTHEIKARMWDVGQFPCIKLREAHDDLVTGQIIDVTESDLEKLDRYEGVPILYTREKTIAHKIGDSAPGEEVFVYEWAGNTSSLQEIATWDN
jgi:gamma-glutamylcyclotransferase (GGCT)/AIG2-like uncharacterized protein YtfP